VLRHRCEDIDGVQVFNLDNDLTFFAAVGSAGAVGAHSEVWCNWAQVGGLVAVIGSTGIP
jgi:hypothetical protein